MELHNNKRVVSLKRDWSALEDVIIKNNFINLVNKDAIGTDYGSFVKDIQNVLHLDEEEALNLLSGNKDIFGLFSELEDSINSYEINSLKGGASGEILIRKSLEYVLIKFNTITL